MEDFYSKIRQTQDNTSITENGAVGYKSTGKDLIDFFFAISSMRNKSDSAVKKEIQRLIKSNDPYILKLLFYIRDIREGLGERRLFRTFMSELLAEDFENKNQFFTDVITKHIPEYGRYDDEFVFVGTEYEEILVNFIRSTLKADLKAKNESKPITLLAKWMPSINTSSYKTRDLAKFFVKALGLSERDYRKTLSELRKYNNIVERQMCAKEWGEIDYNKVPSRANVNYNNAFLRKDETRRRQYLNDLVRGFDKEGNKVKINSSVNTPHDVLHMYGMSRGWYGVSLKAYDEAIEQLWKNLKQVPGLKDTIVVRDDSGSMTSTIGNTNISAYEVATALGIYCAEHNSEAYRNKIITFSETPRYLDFSDEKHFGSLHSKYDFLLKHSEVANTNIEAVFDLILATAVENRLDASELPAQILIISDMEFDSCSCTNSSRGYNWGYGNNRINVSLFDNISAKFAQFGYKLPKLVFWNVNSRTGTIPCKQNDLGVLLVSGFSQNVLSMINNGEIDPYKNIVKQLDISRYEEIPLFKSAKINRESKKEKQYTSPLEK